MTLHIGFNKSINVYVIQIHQESTGNKSTILTFSITGITNFINLVKGYDKISLLFDASLTVQQKNDIKLDIAQNVKLP